ncbi:MAG: twin-arginine translocase TatA/TatE family subunit [Planctomycetaceae bacterium]|nr:twin-arginine translocase TatA/TatE family subunit [Planctomycetaceae bacterium]
MILINSTILGFLGPSSAFAYIILGVVAFLLFGNRLPSVMRSLGRSVVEFKKGVAGIEDELDEAVRTAEEKATSKSGEKTEV